MRYFKCWTFIKFHTRNTKEKIDLGADNGADKEWRENKRVGHWKRVTNYWTVSEILTKILVIWKCESNFEALAFQIVGMMTVVDTVLHGRRSSILCDLRTMNQKFERRLIRLTVGIRFAGIGLSSTFSLRSSWNSAREELFLLFPKSSFRAGVELENGWWLFIVFLVIFCVFWWI